MPQEEAITANLVIIGGVLAVMFGISVLAGTGLAPDAIIFREDHRQADAHDQRGGDTKRTHSVSPPYWTIQRYPSVAYAFWLFFVAYLGFFADYVLFTYESNMTHVFFHVASNTAANLTSVCTLMAAVAYCRGGQFDFRETKWWMLGYLFANFLWMVFFEWIGHRTSLFKTALETAPVAVSSMVAFISLGWVFFVRWGLMAGAPFFVVSVAYAFLQLPGFVGVDLADVEKISKYIRTSDLGIVYPVLAGGKILVAFGFLSLLYSYRQAEVAINDAKYWPTHSVSPPYWTIQIFLWIAAWVGSIITMILTDPVKSIVTDLVKSLVKSIK